MEASRNVERLERAFAQVSVGAISGAVGTYAATSPEFTIFDHYARYAEHIVERLA